MLINNTTTATCYDAALVYYAIHREFSFNIVIHKLVWFKKSYAISLYLKKNHIYMYLYFFYNIFKQKYIKSHT